ncbi:DNA-directed RNA polymerase subunit H [Salinigranum rubrum]|jgi:DNA-directed RNA polymerase subunit H|uniref:DNA-directed RNA polymerase subunit Rpo5 n=1 Tax=Salinigranum rubrum TaxID=755307 RepID=A0A2I8VHS0_9EURY|nr:DNA-directed RNA polymerase subunit H [Salinigranum rubrum]AUV80599.1 DNA-directed RNA polymerase subunit H [Salinigranum rubrum]
MVNVSEHTLVPEHAILDEPEIEEMMAEYDVERVNLPKIRTSDPALPDEAEAGDVVKIVRDSRTTDTAVVYRLVIE